MERLGPVTLSDVAEAFGELLAEAGSYPGDAAPVYGEADGWAEEPGMPAAPYGEELSLTPQDDPAGILAAIAEPILLAALWGRDPSRTEIAEAVRSLRAVEDVYGIRLGGIVSLLLTYAETLPGKPGEP